MPHFLSEVRLAGLRGIDGLRAAFEYPVCVLAGGNGSGKSTVLRAAACGYRVPGAGVRGFVPSALFPDYRPRGGRRRDEQRNVAIGFEYATPAGRQSMHWRRSAGRWSRSFLGRRGAAQPERPVYFRMLGGPGIARKGRGALMTAWTAPAPAEAPLTPLQIEFAQRMLPFRYAEVAALPGAGGKPNDRKTLLFAAREDGAAYSELHMAAGERVLLRLSLETAHLKGALVLIDDIEAGLHPRAQELLMLHLQELALLNDLQVIATTHSPVVLDSVPPEARIFLERDAADRVTVGAPYPGIVRAALYGRSGEALYLLCENAAAEGVLRSVMDRLAQRPGIGGESARIGRDAGAGEFPRRASVLAKFDAIRNFVFVLSGDKRGAPAKARIDEAAGCAVPALFLPGRGAPEEWAWERLGTAAAKAAAALGLDAADLTARMERLDSIYASAAGPHAEIAEMKLRGLADGTERTAAEICRVAAAIETGRKGGDIRPLAEELAAMLARRRDG